jgi:hypothetical protein
MWDETPDLNRKYVKPILPFLVKLAIAVPAAYIFVFTAQGRYIVWALGIFGVFSLFISVTRKWWQPILDNRKAKGKGGKTENLDQK